MKIRNKFMMPIIVFLFIFLIIFGIYLNNIISNMKEKEMNNFIEFVSTAFVNTIEKSIWDLRFEDISQVASGLFDDERIYEIKIMSKDLPKDFIREKEYEVKYSELIEKEFRINDGFTDIALIKLKFSRELIEKQYLFLMLKVIIVCILAFLVLILVIAMISKSIVKPIEKIEKRAKRLKDGDFSETLYVNSNDEIETINHSFNSTINKIKDTLEIITDKRDIIKDTSEELTQNNESLATNASQQAATNEQISASLEQIYTGILNNAKKVKDLNLITQKNKEEFETVGKNSIILKEAMEKIEQSSNNINAIVTIIDDIAFQINLLSLNAAIEAARSEGATRGFTVVSEEIRKLAKRISRATTNIKESIEGSSENIERGKQFAIETDVKMKSAVKQTVIIADFIEKLTKDTEIKLKALSDVRNEIVELDDITQSNAGLSEETASIAENLKHEIDNFAKVFNYFKLKS